MLENFQIHKDTGNVSVLVAEKYQNEYIFILVLTGSKANARKTGFSFSILASRIVIKRRTSGHLVAIYS